MSAEVRISAVGDASGMAPLNRSITEMRAELVTLKKAFDNAKPNSAEQQKIIGQIYDTAKAIDAEEDSLKKALNALREKEAAEKAAAAATLKAAEAERIAREAVQKRYEAIMKAAAAEKENRRVAAMGNPWTTASRTAVAAGAVPGSTPPPAPPPTLPKLKGLPNVASMPGITGADAASGGGNPAMALLMASQAFEDAQYGIRGVLNNIPPLIMALGGGAGLAGALSIAAVAASQLWERLGGGGDALDKSGLEKLKEMAAQTRAEFDALGATMEAQLGDRLKATVAQARAELDAFKTSLESAQKGLARDLAAMEAQLKKVTAGSELDAQRSMVEGTPEAEAKRQLNEAARLEAQNTERARLLREQKAAENNLQIAGLGVQAGRDSLSQAQATLAGLPEARQAEIDALRKANVISDQEQIVTAYDTAALRAPGFNRSAMDAEEKLSQTEQAMLSASPLELPLLTARRALEKRRAEERRKAADENNAELNKNAPFADLARSQLASGEVTFNRAAESGLIPQQKYALEQGKASLTNLTNQEAAAKEQMAAAQKQITDAGKSAQEFGEAVKNAAAALSAFETRSAAQNIEAARNGAALPALPGQEAQVPYVGPGLPALSPDMPNGNGRTAGAQEALMQLDQLSAQAKDDPTRQRIAELRALLTDRDGATQSDLQQVASFVESLSAAVPQVVSKIAQVGNTLANGMTQINNNMSALVNRVSNVEAQISRTA